MNAKFLLFLLGLIATQSLNAAPFPSEKDQEIKVVFVSGKVSFTNNTNGGAIQKDQNLTKGDTLITGEDGYIDVVSSGNYTVRLNPNSKLTLKSIAQRSIGNEQQNDSRLYLSKGSILCATKKMSVFSAFEITTPVCQAAIRGTSFFLSADGFCRVAAGQIVVVYGEPTANNRQVVPVSASMTSEPPLATNASLKRVPTPKDVARSLERDFKDLTEHRLRKNK